MVDQRAALQPLHEGVIPGLLDQLGHAVHGPVELDLLPGGRAGLAVQDLGGAVGILVELVGGRALGAEAPLVVGAARIALDVHDLVADRADDRGAADGAVGADAGG
jgi:hypothetical protein